jgi:hypothetical protein
MDGGIGMDGMGRQYATSVAVKRDLNTPQTAQGEYKMIAQGQRTMD